MLAGDQDAAVGIIRSDGPPGSDPIQIVATDGETVDAKEQKHFFPPENDQMFWSDEELWWFFTATEGGSIRSRCHQIEPRQLDQPDTVFLTQEKCAN